MEACVFLLDLFRKQARGRTPYEGFEQIILCILVFIISVIIIYVLILVIITLADDFRAGIVYMETGAMKDTFGLILTVIILLEFDRFSNSAKVGCRAGSHHCAYHDHRSRAEARPAGLRRNERGDALGTWWSCPCFGWAVLADLGSGAAQAQSDC